MVDARPLLALLPQQARPVLGKARVLGQEAQLSLMLPTHLATGAAPRHRCALQDILSARIGAAFLG